MWPLYNSKNFNVKTLKTGAFPSLWGKKAGIFFLSTDEHATASYLGLNIPLQYFGQKNRQEYLLMKIFEETDCTTSLQIYTLKSEVDNLVPSQ